MDYISVLGTRGSLPASGKNFLKYGGSTTCFLVRMDGESVILDAGTGILHLPDDVLTSSRLTLLLTHPHVDHMLGLVMCPYLSRKNAHLAVYAKDHDGRPILSQIGALFSPPLWPVGPAQMPAECTFHSITGPFRIGNILVESLDGIHPGGVSVFRLTGKNKRIVFATDCTFTEDFRPNFLAFAKGCDVLLIDGQYSDEEWPGRETFGHTRWKDAAALAAECEAACIRIIHHDPTHTDEILDAAQSQVTAICPRCSLAREGELIVLSE